MRSRRPAPEQVADVARRRLELLSAELAEIRPEVPRPSSHDERDGSGELLSWSDGRDPFGSDATSGASSGSRPPGRDDGGWDRPTDRTAGRHAHRSLGVGANAARWVEDRLPASLQGRVRLTGGHLAVVALTVAAALALTVWWVTRADGDVTTVASVPGVGVAAGGGDATAGGSADAGSTGAGSTGSGSTGSGSSGSGSAGTGSTGAASVGTGPGGAGAVVPGSGASSVPGTSAGNGTALAPGVAGASPGAAAGTSAAGSSAASIVVDVTGKVRRPGIATLPTGSRVVDAIQAAGGAKHGAKLGTLNLARVLTDGEQVVVGVPAPGGVAASAASAPTSGSAVPMVNVNTATESQLEELPGVGPVTAAAILDYRTENGPFGSVDALLEVSGIGDATLAKIAPYVTL